MRCAIRAHVKAAGCRGSTASNAAAPPYTYTGQHRFCRALQTGMDWTGLGWAWSLPPHLEDRGAVLAVRQRQLQQPEARRGRGGVAAQAVWVRERLVQQAAVHLRERAHAQARMCTGLKRVTGVGREGGAGCTAQHTHRTQHGSTAPRRRRHGYGGARGRLHTERAVALSTCRRVQSVLDSFHPLAGSRRQPPKSTPPTAPCPALASPAASLPLPLLQPPAFPAPAPARPARCRRGRPRCPTALPGSPPTGGGRPARPAAPAPPRPGPPCPRGQRPGRRHAPRWRPWARGGAWARGR